MVVAGESVVVTLSRTRSLQPTPDGCGMKHRNEFIDEGAVLVADDELVLHFRKGLSAF